MKKSKIMNINEIGPILFEESNKAKYLNISISHTKIRVAIPKGISLEDAKLFVINKKKWIIKNLIKIKLKPKIELDLKDINKNKAQEFLINRIKILAINNGFKYNKITIRNQKTRWGSCSQNNNINLNIKLAILPKQLCDYVIFHELVHTKIKNHSPIFWNKLNLYVNNAKKIHKELNQFSLL